MTVSLSSAPRGIVVRALAVVRAVAALAVILCLSPVPANACDAASVRPCAVFQAAAVIDAKEPAPVQAGIDTTDIEDTESDPLFSWRVSDAPVPTSSAMILPAETRPDRVAASLPERPPRV